MARELAVALIDTSGVLEVFVAIVFVGKYFAASRTLVTVVDFSGCCETKTIIAHKLWD